MFAFFSQSGNSPPEISQYPVSLTRPLNALQKVLSGLVAFTVSSDRYNCTYQFHLWPNLNKWPLLSIRRGLSHVPSFPASLPSNKANQTILARSSAISDLARSEVNIGQ